jgi:nucleotide-binding universal stress UspA family protein
MSLKNIVVALDGSPHSDSAVSTAIELSGHFNSRLHGVHVVDLAMLEASIVTDISGSVGFEPFVNLTAELRRALKSAGEAILASFQERCRAAGVAADAAMQEGVIASVIAEKARTADLVALGGRGAGAPHRRDLLGGNAEALIRRLPVPGVVCPEQYTPAKAPILAFDGSARAGRALRLAGEVASVLGLPLAVVSVTDDPVEARRLRGEAEASLVAYGCPVEFRLRKGHPEEEILQEIEAGAGPVFMGSHGHGRIIEFVLGSTTERVLRRAKTAVFLAP